MCGATLLAVARRSAWPLTRLAVSDQRTLISTITKINISIIIANIAKLYGTSSRSYLLSYERWEKFCGTPYIFNVKAYNT